MQVVCFLHPCMLPFSATGHDEHLTKHLLVVASALLDLYLAIHLVVVLWGLQMHIKKKLTLCPALDVGLT